MSIFELLRVTCDGCNDPLIVPQVDSPHGTLFHSHDQALRAASRRRWYVDAKIVLCPGCYLFALEWHAAWTEPEPSPADARTCDSDTRGAVSGHPGAVGQVRGVSDERCTYCGNRAVRRLAGRSVCSAHAMRRGDV